MKATAKCIECGRVFDLTDELDADEWYAGHDCEPWPIVTDGFLGGVVSDTQEETEEDDWCAEHGHQPGCPHDPREEWTWVRDSRL